MRQPTDLADFDACTRRRQVPESQTVAAHALRERIRLLLQRGLVAQATVTVNGALLTSLTTAAVPRRAAVSWFVALVCVAIARACVAARFQKSDLAPPAWIALASAYTVGAAVNGSLWGAASVVFWSPHDFGDQLLLAFVIGGMTAGAATTGASHPPSFIAFAVPALTPLVGRLAAEGDRLHLTMATMLAIFGLAMWRICLSGASTMASVIEGRAALEVMREREKAAQIVLTRMERTMDAVVENARDPVLVYAGGTIVRANLALGRLLGYDDAAALTGRDPLEFVHPEDREVVGHRMRRLDDGAALSRSSAQRLLHRDGSSVAVEFTAFPVFYAGKDCAMATGHDVTERLETMHALREAEERFRLTFDHAPIGIALVSLDGKWLRVNRTLCEIVAYTTEELAHLTFQDITHPDDLDADLALVSKLVAGEIPRYSLAKRYLRKDGAIVDAVLHVSLVRDEANRPLHFISQIEDVTERRRAEAQLARRDRMSSLGTLAAGVAHEINNPLAYVRANLEYVAERLLESSPSCADPELVASLDEARQGTDRVANIVRGLKSFSRADDERRTAMDPRRALDVSLRLASNQIKHRARTVQSWADVPRVRADESRLVQVFTNLLVNAAQAIPEGQADRNEIRIVTRTDERGRAVIEIHDTGTGIAPAAFPRLFEPFFTTKPVGAGTGLGLSVCHGIVTALGGEISAENRTGGGATFRVVLPPAPHEKEAHPRAESASTTLPVPGRTARVLVIDDEPLVGHALRRALGREHDVTVVASGAEALIAINRGARFDVIFCDVMMPAMTGMEFFEHLAGAAPDQLSHVVFCTGGAFTAAAQEFLNRVPNERVEKPFDVPRVRAVIQRHVSADA